MQLTAPESGFLGAPVETDLARIDADVAILGVPYGWPYPRPGTAAGCAEAPAAVRRRAQRLAGVPRPLGLRPRCADAADRRTAALVDAGDVPGDPDDGPGTPPRSPRRWRRSSRRGGAGLHRGRRLGPDPDPARVRRRGPLTVLQVDAHLDFRDEVQGVREGYSSPMRRASEMDHVTRIVQVGLRGVGSARPADVEDARAAGNCSSPPRELRERGVGRVLDRLPADASVFVSFDCDGLRSIRLSRGLRAGPGRVDLRGSLGAACGRGRTARGGRRGESRSSSAARRMRW